MRLTFLKVGTWNPPGLPQLQSSIVEVKTPRHDVFFISLERPWNVHVENGLAWAIQTFVAQVMVERRVGNWPDPGVCRWNETRRWKDLKESYKFALDLFPIRSLSRELWAPKVLGVQTGTISGLLLGSLGNKSHLDAGVAEQRKEYYLGEGGGFPRIWAVVSQVSPRCPWLVPTPRVFPKVN
jgi:hypothetical protein